MQERILNAQIPIGGMHCAACARRIEKEIGKLDGISKVNVNYATEKAAVAFSVYNIFEIAKGNFVGVESLYFESAGVIITLILLGKSLEAVSKGQTGEAIKKLMGLAPKTAFVIRGGMVTEIPIGEVAIRTLYLP